MRRKIILIIMMALSLAVALGYSFFRLAIIRATINLPLPGWIQNLIWGWK